MFIDVETKDVGDVLIRHDHVSMIFKVGEQTYIKVLGTDDPIPVMDQAASIMARCIEMKKQYTD